MHSNSWLITISYRILGRSKKNSLTTASILLVLFALIFSNCKSQQNVTETKSLTVEKPKCLLKNLPITTDYRNQIEKYTSIYSDTIIDIESSIYRSKKYKTILVLSDSTRHLWLLRMNDIVQIDSFLVHCLAPNKSFDVDLNPDSCEVYIGDIDYDGKGETIMESFQ